MNSIKFKLKAYSKNEIVLILHWKFRIFFIALSLLIISVLFFHQPQGDYVISILALLICIGGIFYNEKWVFNKELGIIEKNQGILFCVSIFSIPMDQVEKMHIEVSNKRAYREVPKTERLIQSKYFKLFLVLHGGKYRHIETSPLSHLYVIEERASRLSEFINCPFTSDVPDFRS